ncbi:uncharacterized protein LY89DRAFT_243355 [Mollisia scopiformis]|uniref:C2H2-type domain-containing protein n=1 Tax=Mollisia scopiformis TaxID=149040 RepID=A0A194WUM9_MOLSC|nr:uncharacterized protein LY89DRAFT_243355 [Mollisia scopiformis]KUJ11374.1 hypothetical protein LY89DRAFT_243355 [Mollisia scopiformis]
MSNTQDSEFSASDRWMTASRRDAAEHLPSKFQPESVPVDSVIPNATRSHVPTCNEVGQAYWSLYPPLIDAHQPLSSPQSEFPFRAKSESRDLTQQNQSTLLDSSSHSVNPRASFSPPGLVPTSTSYQNKSLLNRQVPLDLNFVEQVQLRSVPGSPYDINYPYQYESTTPTSQSTAFAFEPDAGLMKVIDAFDVDDTIPLHAPELEAIHNTCHQCKKPFLNKARLDSHATRTKHLPYACRCGKIFSRFDVLGRHIDRFCPRELYPCPYCSKHSGFQAFHRPDHLTQHLQNDHNINWYVSESSEDPQECQISSNSTMTLACSYEGCEYHFEHPARRVFHARKDFTKHLRKEHDDSLFPCSATGCPKVRGNGYFRERDLIQHRRKEHGGPSQSGLENS